MSVADKLSYLNGTKEAIRQAIIGKGVEVLETDAFRAYSSKISSIQSGYPVPTWTTSSYTHNRTSTNNIEVKSFTMPTMNIPNVVNVYCRVEKQFGPYAKLTVTLPSGGIYKISKNNQTPYTLSGGSQLFYHEVSNTYPATQTDYFTVMRIE